MRKHFHVVVTVVAGAIVVALLFILGTSFGNTGNYAGAAERAATEEGMEQVDSVERDRFVFWGGCRKDYSLYVVKGTQDGEPATMKVCVSTFRTYVK